MEISSDANQTSTLTLGDVDGDGDLDLIEGCLGQPNRLYLHNGTNLPFSNVTGIEISSAAGQTRGLCLGDVDGDGDLDLITGNEGQVNRLYFNNGTETPFSSLRCQKYLIKHGSYPCFSSR